MLLTEPHELELDFGIDLDFIGGVLVMNRMAVGVTDVGLVRSNNEDAIFVCNDRISRLQNLFIVADGLGGHKAGETASSMAVECFCEYINSNAGDCQYTELFLADAIRYANGRVYELSRENRELAGMGTTFTVFCTDSVNLYYAHVGDSRLYLIKRGSIRQVTEDHTYVNELIKSGQLTGEEAKKHPNRNAITRAVGTDSEVIVDAGYSPLTDEEFVLICSDGLTNMVDDESIKRIVVSDMDIPQKVAGLVELAKKNGGVDNVSVVLA